jgi:hypothetical protein
MVKCPGEPLAKYGQSMFERYGRSNYGGMNYIWQDAAPAARVKHRSTPWQGPRGKRH